MLPLLDEAYIQTGKLQFVFKEYPVVNGDLSVVASLASQCAANQKKFSVMQDWLFANGDAWKLQQIPEAVAVLKTQAAELGLDGDAFGKCVDDKASLQPIISDYQEGQSYNIRSTPNFVLNGHFIQGYLPFEQMKVFIDALIAEAETGALPDTVVTVTPTPEPEPELHPAQGDPNAPVTIIEYSDYQCPYCLRHYTETMPKLRQQYIETGKVQYIFKDFTPTLRSPDYHPQAVNAAEAAECAGAQGKYWEMHDKLFEEQAEWAGNAQAVDVLKGFAADLGLDTEAFNTCLDTGQFRPEIEADLDEGILAGVQGTPGFFVNGKFLSGAQPFEVFQQLIDQLLAQE